MNRLDLSHSPVALYHFNRSAEDLSGNGLDLSGTLNYTEFEPQHFGLAPGSNAQRSGYDALLAITGPVTLEVTGYFYSTPSGAIFASFTASGETLATNTLWQLSAHTASQLRWIHEFGSSGTDAVLLSTNADCSLPRLHSRFHAASVRDASGVVRLFLNGRQHGDPSAPFSAPTGGTSAFLRVMFGSTAFGLDGLKITPSALTPAQVAASAEYVLGAAPLVNGTLWVGATTHESAVVVARMTSHVTALTLDVSGTPTSPQTTDANNVARFELTGLTADTEYTIALPCGVAGKFRTHPVAAGNPAAFKVAFGGDCNAGSTHPVWQAILNQDPLQFIHLGDWGYPNITANSESAFHAAYDANFASVTQHRLCRNVATQHVWDDHDGAGGNNADGSAAAWPAACAVYRSREPHYYLPHTTAIYQTWDIGRVRFVMTDQRSQASPSAMTDGPSKSMLGATQKAWFKDLISNSADYLIVWICPRWFANANHMDSWNNYATERAELCDHIKANAHGRVVVIEADQHTLAIDDGTNVDHATGGGEPLRCFRAAPLDKTVSALASTYSHGEFNNNGQFGVMEVEDDGENIDVIWRGFDSTGTQLTSLSFTVVVP